MSSRNINERIKRCPECGSINISRKSNRNGTKHREYDSQYRCNNQTCRAHFDKPLMKND